MKKTPSALKWLAESRGRIAHKHSANASVILLLEAKVATLSSELRITELMLSNAKENQLKLDSELKALDQTVQIFDEKLDPSKIESIRGWQGRYGERGALRKYLQTFAESNAPAYLSLSDFALATIAEFSLVFSSNNELREWCHNTLRRALRVLSDRDVLEARQDDISGATSWRPKQQKPKSIAALRKST